MRRRSSLIDTAAAVMAGAVISLALLAACSNSGPDRSLARTDSVIVPIKEDGFYKLPLASLEDAGLDVSGFGESPPRLSQNGNIVPTLATDDALIFYGQAPSDRYTTYRPYVLELGPEGTAMPALSQPPSGKPGTSTVSYTLTFEENVFYDGRPYEGTTADPAMRDPWFWETIQMGDSVEVEFQLPRAPEQAAWLQLDLAGVSSHDSVDPDHDLIVGINGKQLDSVHWDGETAATLIVDVPDGLLSTGNNRLTLDNLGVGAAPIDIMRLDRFTVGFAGPAAAIDGELIASAVQSTVALEGFDEHPLVFDVSDPNEPIHLTDIVYENNKAYFEIPQDMVLHAVEPGALNSAPELLIRAEELLTGQENQADLIIVAPEQFVTELESLANHRRKRGLSVMVVSLEQIYDEFAADGVGPAAINAFVKHAYNHWNAPKPAYLLLVGDASYDYRDYLGQEPGIMLPAPMVPVTYSGETVSDARLADVDGDNRPDLAVGRWPVRDSKAVRELVTRTIENEEDDISPTAIFVADGSEQRFLEMNRALAEGAGLVSGPLVQLNGPSNEEFRQAWAEGAWVVTYSGHGSLDRWGKESLLDNETATGLEATLATPVVLQLTCLTGLFAHPTITSLSELMLSDEDGPVSIVAATSLTLSEHQRPFGEAFLQALQNPDMVRVGDAFQWAKLQLPIETDSSLREISDTFTLFGDPTAMTRRPLLAGDSEQEFVDGAPGAG